MGKSEDRFSGHPCSFPIAQPMTIHLSSTGYLPLNICHRETKLSRAHLDSRYG